MGWAFFWLFVVLKIPVIAAIWLVWWSAKAPEADDERADEDENGGGGSHPREPKPRPPRRGPHAEPPPDGPPRVRKPGRQRESRPARR